jgi:hypothetical protein
MFALVVLWFLEKFWFFLRSSVCYFEVFVSPAVLTIMGFYVSLQQILYVHKRENPEKSFLL